MKNSKKYIQPLIILVLLGIIVYLFFYRKNVVVVDNINDKQQELLDSFSVVTKDIKNLKTKINVEPISGDALKRYIDSSNLETKKELENLKTLIKTEMKGEGLIETVLSRLDSIEQLNLLVIDSLSDKLKSTIDTNRLEDYAVIDEKINSSSDSESYLLLQGVVDLKNYEFIGGYKYNTVFYHTVNTFRKNIFSPYKSSVSVWSKDNDSKFEIESILVEHKLNKFSIGFNVSYGLTYGNNGTIVARPFLGIGLNYSLISF